MDSYLIILNSAFGLYGGSSCCTIVVRHNHLASGPKILNHGESFKPFDAAVVVKGKEVPVGALNKGKCKLTSASFIPFSLSYVSASSQT